MSAWGRRCPRFAVTHAATQRLTGLQLVEYVPVPRAQRALVPLSMRPALCGRLLAIRENPCSEMIWRDLREE